MNTTQVPDENLELIYPSSDGLPMADSSQQFDWIKLVSDNLDDLFEDNPDVLVGGNLFWYPVEGEPEIVPAPDVYVALGRPKGERKSYLQWKENNVPMTVVFENRSYKDSDDKMANKLAFYDEHGVQEYYCYDPQKHVLEAYLRKQVALVLTPRVRKEFTSPLLKIRFEMTADELIFYRPSGERFLPYKELATRQREAEARNHFLEKRLGRLKELGRKARQGLASSEELLELDRLEQET